jgi:hypothetical protein
MAAAPAALEAAVAGAAILPIDITMVIMDVRTLYDISKNRNHVKYAN